MGIKFFLRQLLAISTTSSNNVISGLSALVKCADNDMSKG